MVKKVKNRKIHWKYYSIAAAFAILLFFSGLLLGMIIELKKISYLEEKFKELEISRIDNEVENLLASYFNISSCEIFKYRIEKIIPLVAKFGDEVELYEATKKINTKEYENLKKKYTLLNIRYWIFVEKLKETCHYNFTTILYFYSNKNCKDCEMQGYVLSYIKKKYPQKVMIFAIDGNMNLETVKMLKNIYNVTEYPTLVINGHVLKGFQSLETIKDLGGIDIE